MNDNEKKLAPVVSSKMKGDEAMKRVEGWPDTEEHIVTKKTTKNARRRKLGQVLRKEVLSLRESCQHNGDMYVKASNESARRLFRAEKAESERDQLAAAVEKMREKTRHISYYEGDEVCWEQKKADEILAIPANYKSILEARDKRVRAEVWQRAISMADERRLARQRYARVTVGPVASKAMGGAEVAFELRELFQAEKGEKG